MSRLASKHVGVLPLTPRLLSREAAAAYCGMTAPHFMCHIAPHIQPLRFGSKVLWDVKAIDHWLDGQDNHECVSAKALLELLQ
jgi:hypothetical protein